LVIVRDAEIVEAFREDLAVSAKDGFTLLILSNGPFYSLSWLPGSSVQKTKLFEKIRCR
jgi:hypothetical protein